MEDFKQKIKNSAQLKLIFADLHLISLLALACFFVFEKKWPGLISFYIYPAALLLFWLITVILISINRADCRNRAHLIPIFLIIILAAIFLKITLGSWIYLAVSCLPAALLALKRRNCP